MDGARGTSVHYSRNGRAATRPSRSAGAPRGGSSRCARTC